jgi:DNA-binding beta-propeller fold protein YncE
MPPDRRKTVSAATLVVGLIAVVALALPVAAPASAAKGAAKKRAPGTLTQLGGKRGCVADRSARARGCARARALDGPGPFMGSRAIALSPDGRHAYVAASNSNAIAVFKRDAKTGVLTQAKGAAGCIAAKAAAGCRRAYGLIGPNSVALSPDGRHLYATARGSAAIITFVRDKRSGALRQLPGAEGCVSGLPIPGCALGRGVSGPDVVVVSPDGLNVYLGSFFGDAVASFARNQTNGGLVQLEGTAGCIAAATAGCATGIALDAVEGLAISADGSTVYAAAAVSNALTVLGRDPATGALAQATDGSGCIVERPLAGCVTGVQIAGANAVAVSPRGGDVYATSLFSNSLTAFEPTATGVAQLPGTQGCVIYLRSAGCSFGRALVAPEGLVVSPDGRNVYAAVFKTGAIAVLNRTRKTGRLFQKPGKAGCLASRRMPGCTAARALGGSSSIAISPDGRFVYSTAYGSDAVDIFRRNR